MTNTLPTREEIARLIARHLNGDFKGAFLATEEWARINACADAIRSLFSPKGEGELVPEPSLAKSPEGGAQPQTLDWRPDATDLFDALVAGLCEGTPTVWLQRGHIWLQRGALAQVGVFLENARYLLLRLQHRSRSETFTPGSIAPELLRRAEELLAENVDAVSTLYHTALQAAEQALINQEKTNVSSNSK